MPLLDLWTSSPQAVLEMDIKQIVSVAGDGKLMDNSDCSNELKEYLAKVDRNYLLSYAQQCLDQSFQDSGFVLQDIVNEVGRRLGMRVRNGVYRGKQQNNNCDGLWSYKSWTFVVEVKTTDAYAISLQKIAGYLASELSEANADCGSCLIVVGRQDTGTLEDQLRGSKYNWKMRIVGVEALFKALELREQSEDPALTERIAELLIPAEYTRVDQIISTAFEFASDREDALEDASEEAHDPEDAGEPQKTRTILSDRDKIEALKVDIAAKLSARFSVSFNRSRSMFENIEHGVRFVIAVSKAYSRKDKYWYAYHPRQARFLSDSKNGFFVLGCLDTEKSFAIPHETMADIAPEMGTTTPEGDESKTYCHVVIRYQDGRHTIFAHRTQRELPIEEYVVI